MTARVLVLLATLVVLMPGTAPRAATPGDFRFLAAVTGDLTPGLPVRLPLPRPLIAATTSDYADLRLFDDDGQETPYLIQAQGSAPAAPPTFDFRLLSYNRHDHEEVIVLERPEPVGAFRDLTLVTAARDFHKTVRLQTSDDLATWEDLLIDTIFDFAARIALRKTTIEVPETASRYVRLLLQDVAPATAQDLSLRYEGLHVQLGGSRTSPFRLDRISGQRVPSAAEAAVYDQAAFPHPDTALDQEGNTVVQVGHVNVPVATLTLQVDNVYYHRRVELWAAQTDSRDAYRPVASGVIYKIPGMRTANNTLSVPPARQPYVQLKIINDDNPPLRLRRVDIAWLRQNLYFIPEAGRRYTLYWRGASVPAPRYELQPLLPAETVKRQQYMVVSTGEVRQNPDYTPPATPRPWRLSASTLLTVVILLLAVGMGFWLYHLLKSLPGR